MPYQAEVFISYSREDEELMGKLAKHMSALVISGQIRPWTDRCLMPGELWEPQIRKKLESADIIIILISADYWSGSFAPREELSVAIERAKAGQATIVPIILKPCMWQKSLISQFNVLPVDGTPLTLSPNIDMALAEITEKLYELATAINERRSNDTVPFNLQNEADRIRNLLPPQTAHNKPLVRLLKVFPHPQRVLDAAFNRTGSKLATVCNDGRVRVFDARDFGQEAQIQTRPRSLQSVSWSRTSREIATGDSDGSVRIWRDNTEVRHLPVGQGAVWDAEYNLDGKALAVASEDGCVSLWNPRRPRLLWKRQIHEKEVNTVRFSHSGSHIVTSSSDGNAVVLDAANGHEVCRFAKHEDRASIALFVSTEFDQETSCISTGADGRLFLWSIANATQSVEVTKHSFWVRALTCSMEGDFVVSGGYDGAVKFIDLRTGEIFESASVDQGPIYCVRLSHDSELLVISAEDCNAYMFSLTR